MYALELGYYYSSLFACLFIDHKRSDYKILIAHHVITIFLMSFSWLDNFWRMGTFVLMTMDICDVMLELSKMVNYCGFRKTADECFGLFVVTWIAFRLVLYPYGALLTSYECKLLVFGIIRTKRILPQPASTCLARQPGPPSISCTLLYGSYSLFKFSGLI